LGASQPHSTYQSGIRSIWNGVECLVGKSNFPYHAQSAQWELYLVISGKALFATRDGRTEVVPGDAFIFGQMNRIS